MITQEQLEEFLLRGHEISGVEFKGPGLRSDGYLCAKVARAVMGMTNRRDGGIVIIGVEERHRTLNPVGLSLNEVESWRNYDHVGNTLANYMSPPPTFVLGLLEYQGKTVVVLEVDEFIDIPILCKKDYFRDHRAGHREVVLREGACYIRSRHKAETIEVSSLEQMRDLLDLAIEKGVKKFITQAQRAGMSLFSSNQPNDRELFDQQIENWSSPLIEKIQSRGYWRVIIRPDNFIEERISEIITLYPLMQKVSVNLRGWDFPHTSWEVNYQMGNDWAGLDYEKDWICESWRFYQSCQFIDFSGLMEDWRDQSKWHPAPEGWRPGEVLTVEGVVYRLTEIFEFASRLALSNERVFDEKVRIEILLSGLKGRQLYLSSARWLPLLDRFDTSADSIPFNIDLLKEDLIANPRRLALQCAEKLFQRFKWSPSGEMLQDLQSGLINA